MTNRGTAYIIYFDTPDAESAIAHMHEAQVDGAVISVSIVLPRRKFSRSPPPARRGAQLFDRFENRGPSGGYRGGPPPPSFGGLEAVGIVRRYLGEPVHREGHIGQEAHEIAILILTDRGHTLGQDPGHDLYQLGLVVEPLCAGTEGRYGEIHLRRHQEEGGGEEVLAIQVFQATVIGVAAEVGPGMEGEGDEPFYSREDVGLSHI